MQGNIKFWDSQTKTIKTIDINQAYMRSICPNCKKLNPITLYALVSTGRFKDSEIHYCNFCRDICTNCGGLYGYDLDGISKCPICSHTTNHN